MGCIGMKMRNTQEGIARRAAGRRARLDALAPAMHADYQRPMSLNDVARKYGTDKSTVRAVFIRNGLTVRPFKTIARQSNGSPVRYAPLTEAQLDALIEEETKLRCPPALKFEWRRWSLQRRGDFIARLRAKLNSPDDRPATPFSTNVEPFDYTSPSAWRIVNAMNAGRDSRSAAVKIDLKTQGVIFRDQLWFWNVKVGYQRGPWSPESGRPSLHQTIWEETHGRPVPPAHVVRFADGNRNNFDPANLTLATRNDVCRENHAIALIKKSRERTAILLRRSQQATPHHDLTHRLLAS